MMTVQQPELPAPISVSASAMFSPTNYVALPLLVAIAWSLASDKAAAITAAELLQSCEAVTSGHTRATGHMFGVPRVGLPCWYYMSAIQNVSVLVDQDRQPLLGICAPANTTLLNYVRVFVQYARRKRVSLPSNAAALAVEALSEAFPCDATTAAK